MFYSDEEATKTGTNTIMNKKENLTVTESHVIDGTVCLQIIDT